MGVAAAWMMAGCPSVERRVVVRDHPTTHPDDPLAAPSLRFIDHWARCTPGEALPQEALVVGTDGEALVGPKRLVPGEVAALPVPAGPFRAGIRAVGSGDVSGSFEHIASPETASPARPWPLLEEGCSPYHLRQDALAALVLIAVGDGGGTWGERLAAAPADAFTGEVRVAGLAVQLAPGRRVTVRVPRGAQALRLRPASPWPATCASAAEPFAVDSPITGLIPGQRGEVRAQVDGAGLVVAIGPCGVVGAFRL
jgi:hypothetical protein